MNLNLHPTRNARRSHGFSLIEIIIVITIIGLVVAWAGSRIFGQADKAKLGLAKARITDISAQLDMYKLDTGRYPSTNEGLRALLANPGGVGNWNGPYVKNADAIKDPWNNDMIYKSPGDNGRPFDLTSLGADGKEGGEGADRDVSSFD
ncbi:MAG: type II secretion system major pseudopilin GspG [Burkholderiales bacterium]|jgi:general secretion pathway protein G|nr:type II secretion system major pseudopilin GspG [Nitrosomonadaceae bacterium]